MQVFLCWLSIFVLGKLVLFRAACREKGFYEAGVSVFDEGFSCDGDSPDFTEKLVFNILSLLGSKYMPVSKAEKS